MSRREAWNTRGALAGPRRYRLRRRHIRRWPRPPTLTGLFPAGAAARPDRDRHGVAGRSTTGRRRAGPTAGASRSRPRPRRGSSSFAVADDAEPGRPLGPALRRGGGDGAPAVRRRHPPRGRSRSSRTTTRAGPRPFASPSATVNGRLGEGGRRGRVLASPSTRGQTLVADLEANRHLGSPMDAVLQVVSALRVRPRPRTTTPSAATPGSSSRRPPTGRYIVRLFAFPATPDSSIRFAGGEPSSTGSR